MVEVWPEQVMVEVGDDVGSVGFGAEAGQSDARRPTGPGAFTGEEEGAEFVAKPASAVYGDEPRGGLAFVPSAVIQEYLDFGVGDLPSCLGQFL
jgi:hypothetical protein